MIMVKGPELVFAQHVKPSVDGGHAGPSRVEALDSCEFPTVRSALGSGNIISDKLHRPMFSTVKQKQIEQQGIDAHWMSGQPVTAVIRELTETLNCTEITVSLKS